MRTSIHPRDFPRWVAGDWPTVLLLLWLPGIKWALAPGAARLALFYGGGCLLGGLAVWRGGDVARVRVLLRAPLAGGVTALLGFAALMVGSTLLWISPILQTGLPKALVDLVILFDPLPVILALQGGGPHPGGWLLLGAAGGALAEEWIFRVVLLWRWVPAGEGLPTRGMKLLLVSGYFAALHWPQAPFQMGVALSGALLLGALLLWRRNFALVAVLHSVFNLKIAAGW